MKKNLLSWGLVLVFLLTGCSAKDFSQIIALEDRISRIENGLLINQSIEDRMEYHKVPGVSIAVINNFELEWSKGYGVLELGGNETVTSDTLFQAASISKPVTAVAALHYVEHGLLDLDENVNNRLVSWQIPENEFTEQADVTLYRLLSHTAGVNQSLFIGYAPGENIPTMQQVLDGEPPAKSKPVRVDRVPGTREYYSNGGYLIVAQLLEDSVGKPFSELMQESIFTPIGMTSSTFDQNLSPEWEVRAASAHGWDVAAWQESPGLVAPGKWNSQDVGMSGLWTTAPDLARFGVEIMKAYAGKSDQVISQEMAVRMLTPVSEGIPLQEPYSADQALGFSLIHLGQKTFMIHFGGSFPGYISVLVGQPERGFGVVIMTNAWSGDEIIWEILYSVLYAYGIMPSSDQILKMGFSLILFLAAISFWPGRSIVRKIRIGKTEPAEDEKKRSKVALIAHIVLFLTIAAILVLTFLYRGPLGGALVHSLDRGEPVLVKALLGIFFSSPIFLVVITFFVWIRRTWSFSERILYSLLVLAALVGVYLLLDLQPLMFWG